MSSINSIISISIVAATANASRASFGVPMIVGYHTNYSDRVRTYTSLAGLVSDGFAVTDQIYLAATALLSQNPSISSFKVGRRALAQTQGMEITPTVANSHEYTVTIDGTDYSYTSDASTDAAHITQGIVDIINTVPTDLEASTDDTIVSLDAYVAGTMSSVELSGSSNTGESLWSRSETTTDPGIATDLNAILNIDSDFYGLILDSNSSAEIEAAAAWAETNKKLFAATSADNDILTTATDDIASTLQDSSYDYSRVSYSHNPHKFLSAGLMGVMFPKDAGSATWAWKTVSGVPVTTFTATHITNMEAKNCNYYVTARGLNVTFDGVQASGEYTDVIQGIDWTTDTMQADFASALANNDKIPYTSQGQALIDSIIRGVLLQAASRDFITADSISIVVPAPSALSDATKAARGWTGVTFSATLAGATHGITIQGTVTI